MLYAFRCRCGTQLQVERQHLGTAVPCPTCRELFPLPALGRPASYRPPTAVPVAESSPTRKRLALSLAAGLTVLVGVALAFFLRRPADPGVSPEDRPAASSPVAKAPIRRLTPAVTERQPKNKEPEPIPLPEETSAPSLAAATTLLPAAPAAPETPTAPLVARTEPPQPLPGKSFTVHLGGAGQEGGPWVYQFRTDASAPWQTAKAGRVVLAALKPVPLTLQFRLLDGRANPSAIVTRTWTPRPLPEVVKRKPGLKKGDRFYQEVVFGRVSAFRVLGADIRNQSQYAFLSRFEVEEVTDDGPRTVTQKVEAVRLTRADADQQARLNALLQKTKGATFRITLGPGGEVVKFEGEQTPLALARGGALTGELTFLMQSTLDLDGWKELAQLTFFRPPQERGKDGLWRRKLVHNWGPLGAWTGEVACAAAGKVGALDRYDYRHFLTYAPPKGGRGMLPFEVSRADFRLLPSGGSIAFDATRGRVAAAEERFRVRGLLAASALGVTSTIEMEETQHFRLRILDRKPTDE